MSPVPECGSPQPPAANSSANMDQATSSFPTTLENIFTNGGGGSSDGRVSTAASSTGGGAHTDPSHNGGGQPADTQPPTTDTNSSKREPTHKGFNLSNVVFEYGGSTDEERYMTTNNALYVQQQRSRPLSSTSTNSFTHNTINDDPLTICESSLRCGFSTIPEDALLGLTAAEHNPPPTSKQPHLAGPNELFFGTGERSSGVSHRDREERLRHLRDKQQMERQQKLEELKEHAAAAQRFREQQEAQRRLRLHELRSRDQDRRSQVEERRRYMEQADQQRKEASFRKNVERDQRLETKRRNERSNIVFAFGSSTPRMLDPKENISYWASRRATSISNVTMGAEAGSSDVNRRSSDSVDGGAVTGAPELARKRATSAQGLDRNPNDLRMSSSMYEVFHWTDSSSSTGHSPLTPQGGDDLMSRSMVTSVARRRTDLHPITPSLREAGKPRHRSPGVRSGGVTPSTPSSRPTSALSQASTTTTTGAVVMRTRTTPRKPRPMSIAGSAPSTADRPRSPVNRESRNTLRNTSSGSISSVKSSRAKSVGGSDSSGPSTPAVTPAPRTPKRTPGQVKAESNAKKAEKAKAPAAATTRRITPKTTPVASPSVENKPLMAAANTKTISKKTVTEKPIETDSKQVNSEEVAVETAVEAVSSSVATSVVSEAETATSDSVTIVENGVSTTTVTETQEITMESGATELASEQTLTTSEVITETVLSETVNGETVITETITTTVEDSSQFDAVVEEVTTESSVQPSPVMEQGHAEPAAAVEPQIEEAAESEVVEPVQNNNDGQAAEAAPEISNDAATDSGADSADINGSGSASERPVTGYATEEEYKAVLAEKRRLAREAKEREIEMERKREEEEAERERREEEEMLRLMVEQREAEENRLRMAIEQADREREEEAKRKEEEEKQRIEMEKQEAERQKEAEEKLRKEEEERLSRKSRVAAIMARTRSKGGSTTNNKAESKTPSDDNKTISEVLLKANLTDSMIDKMSDSMIAAATSLESELESYQASSGVSSEPGSDFSSQPSSDVSGQPPSDVSSQGTMGNTTDSYTSGASSLEQTVRWAPTVDLLNTGLADLTLHTNGNTLLPTDSTTTQACDLLGSLNGHTNGVDNSNSQQPCVDLLGSFDPLSSEGAQFPDRSETVDTTTSQFEQIIDASQTKLSNEDAINSNPPAAPFIAFEQNLNKKSPENNTSVPDILL